MDIIQPYLPYSQVIISILLVIAILLQQKGSGLGIAFGGDDSVYRTKRGVEKGLFVFTIILAFLFLLSSALSLFVR
ncbi:MAG: preprotein translocase subunit SecG [bacterium]